MVKLAVVGTGLIVKEMLPVWQNMEEIQVEVLCGTARSAELVEALRDQYGIPYSYTDYGKMLTNWQKHPADAIYIAVPNQLHYEMAKEAIDCGINVFLEKPFTPTAEEAQDLIERSRRKPVMLLEAISNQYVPSYEKIREQLPQLGRICYVDCNYSQYSTRYDRFLQGDIAPCFDPACWGGALMDLGVYNVHLLAGLFGAPQAVTYQASMSRGVDTNGILLLDYDGFRCTAVAAKDSQGPSRFLIQGTEGYLSVEAGTNTLQGPLQLYLHKDRSCHAIYEPDKTHRMVWEFRALDRILREEDWQECIRRQEETLIVSRVLEEAREMIHYGEENETLARLRSSFWK